MFDEQMAKIDGRPENFGAMRDASTHAKIKGPCGDTVEIWLRIDGGKIRKATYRSDGCGYSNACGSAAAKLSEGMTPIEASELTQEAVLSAVGSIPEDHHHCALLSANAIKQAIENIDSIPTRISLGQRIKQRFSKGHGHV